MARQSPHLHKWCTVWTFLKSWYEKFMLLSSFHCEKFFNGQKVVSLQRMWEPDDGRGPACLIPQATSFSSGNLRCSQLISPLQQPTLNSNIGPNSRTNLNFSSLALTTKTPNTWKRYPIPSYSKWRLKNIYPNTLKWVTNARNWNYSLLATPKSIHLQYSQRLKKSESAQIIWVKSEKLK